MCELFQIVKDSFGGIDISLPPSIIYGGGKQVGQLLDEKQIGIKFEQLVCIFLNCHLSVKLFSRLQKMAPKPGKKEKSSKKVISAV